MPWQFCSCARASTISPGGKFLAQIRWATLVSSVNEPIDLAVALHFTEAHHDDNVELISSAHTPGQF